MKEVIVQNVDVDLVLKKNKIVFPVDTLDELKRIEGLLGETKIVAAIRKFFRTIKPTTSSRPSAAGLAKILSDKLLSNFNWKGISGKHSLQMFDLFGVVLFGWSIFRTLKVIFR
jgi:Domain of unknown function (DUF4806)